MISASARITLARVVSEVVITCATAALMLVVVGRLGWYGASGGLEQSPAPSPSLIP